jgi:putative membrane protein
MGLAMLQAETWTGAGHPEPGTWMHWLGLVGPWAVLAVLVALVLRALLHRRRYRALSVLGAPEQERVHEAIRAAERRTVGEVLPVVVERSDPHPAAEWLAALVFLLTGTAALVPHLPWREPLTFLLVQLAFGLLGYGLARFLPAFKRMFVFERRAELVAEEQAFQEFYANGLQRTPKATGVLLFVSLFERRVVVLADEGIAAQVEPQTWKQVDEVVLAGIRRGSLADGLVEGVARVGEVLAGPFPRGEGDPNEIPDRLVVRRE